MYFLKLQQTGDFVIQELSDAQSGSRTIMVLFGKQVISPDIAAVQPGQSASNFGQNYNTLHIQGVL